MKTIFSSARRTVWALMGVALLGSTFAACNKDDNNGGNGEVPVSGLMVMNLSPDLAANVALSGSLLTNTPLTYTSYTGGYLAIYSGNRTVQTYDYNLGNQVAADSFNFEDDQYYSLFVTGTSDHFTNVVVPDKLNDLSGTAGKAYIRYINAIPDSTALSVTLDAGGEVTNNTASYNSVSDFVPVTAGDVAIGITGSNDIDVNRTINFKERNVYTVLLVGNPMATGADSVQIRYVQNGTLDAATNMDSTNVNGRVSL